MVHLKIWKDADGYGVQVDSEQFGLSDVDLSILIEELRSLQDEVIGEEDEGIQREIVLGIED